eukprot:Lithocolla_globosa_v1_NODE_2220_length_2104_cov_18.222548.p3 type:complete len:115 gc:universal NODE_2220_length_2104_cov_18.222548:700-1044(+)
MLGLGSGLSQKRVVSALGDRGAGFTSSPTADGVSDSALGMVGIELEAAFASAAAETESTMETISSIVIGVEAGGGSVVVVVDVLGEGLVEAAAAATSVWKRCASFFLWCMLLAS